MIPVQLDLFEGLTAPKPDAPIRDAGLQQAIEAMPEQANHLSALVAGCELDRFEPDLRRLKVAAAIVVSAERGWVELFAAPDPVPPFRWRTTKEGHRVAVEMQRRNEAAAS
jgi:hypothetical protein